MDIEAERRRSQLDFVASGQELQVGEPANLPLSVTQLQQINSDSACVREAHTGGLTAHVYCIETEQGLFNLKLKRSQSLVKNVDGQTSFLNEVQRRCDFALIRQQMQSQGKAKDPFRFVVDTRYASYLNGILLSPWIEGDLLDHFDETVLTQLFEAVVNFELNGFIEWDLCPGNILFDGKQIHLFDFGYCYRFNPLTEFNSCGKNAPLFHSIERLETRNFFGYLLKQELLLKEKQQSIAALEQLFVLEKELALEAYLRKFARLQQLGASESVLSWQESIIHRWQNALKHKTTQQDLLLLEGYRSHVLDIHDDIQGQSCTAMTMTRIDKVEQTLQDHFDLLQKQQGLFFGDENLSQAQLLAKIAEQRKLALSYQLKHQS